MMQHTKRLLLFLGFAVGYGVSQELCVSSTNTFTVGVNLFASELGYYAFEECGGVVNPTIVMEVGETYTFIQRDRSNYYHPLGFAYFPDGAHNGVEELEPGISLGSDPSCAIDQTCPAPMYFLNGEYLGDYSNIPEIKPNTQGSADFGLDAYEPLFFRPLPEWAELGEFAVQLKFDDFSYENDIFYFCHIHQFMAGRIKLTQNGVLVKNEDVPPLGYDYDEPGPFDQQCGTFGLDDFQLPNSQCPHEFVCNPPPETKPFADCIEAMNCNMFAGMTTQLSSGSEIALFVHQMVPHHQNAVNMAKTLLMTGQVPCADLTNDEDPACVLQVILREIINSQNKQIQDMRGVLETLGLPYEDDCRVPIHSKPQSLPPTAFPTQQLTTPPVPRPSHNAYSDDVARPGPAPMTSSPGAGYSDDTTVNRLGGSTQKHRNKNRKRARSNAGNLNHQTNTDEATSKDDQQSGFINN